jgi:hypothetical protein
VRFFSAISGGSPLEILTLNKSGPANRRQPHLELKACSGANHCSAIIKTFTVMAEKRKLPIRASEYITRHFRDDFLFEVKQIRESQGRYRYTVEVTKDDYIHTLVFDQDGNLVKKEEDEAFPADMHDARDIDDLP